MRSVKYSLIFLLIIYASIAYGSRDSFHRCVVDELHELDKRYTPNPTSEERLAHNVRDFKVRYHDQTILYEESNAHFIALKNGELEVKPKLYFDTENAILKKQNDHLIDKQFVTALENRYKEDLLRAMYSDPILGKHLLGSYADFKSLRLAFDLDTPEIRASLKRIYKEVGARHEDFLHANGFDNYYGKMKDLEGDPKAWHLAGMASSADQASLFARDVRRQYHEGIPLRIGEETTSKAHLTELVKSLERDRNKIERKLLKDPNGKKAFVDAGNGRLVLSADANDIFRKVPDGGISVYTAEIKKRFKEKFGIEIKDDSTVALLRDYYTNMELFSPGIYSVKRVIVPMDKAPRSILSIDLAGQGARNAVHVEGALARTVKGDLSDVLKAQREGETIATLDMKKRINEVIDAVTSAYQKEKLKPTLTEKEFQQILKKREIDPSLLSEVDRASLKELTLTREELQDLVTNRTYHSGDDIAYLPEEELTVPFRKSFYENLSKSSVRSDYRPVHLEEFMVGTKEKVAPDIRNTVIADGEAFEKEIRKKIIGSAGFANSKERLVAIEMSLRPDGTRLFDVILTGESVTRELSKTLQKDIADILKSKKFEGPMVLRSFQGGGG